MMYGRSRLKYGTSRMMHALARTKYAPTALMYEPSENLGITLPQHLLDHAGRKRVGHVYPNNVG